MRGKGGEEWKGKGIEEMKGVRGFAYCLQGARRAWENGLSLF
jgi:hypothetical protein